MDQPLIDWSSAQIPKWEWAQYWPGVIINEMLGHGGSWGEKWGEIIVAHSGLTAWNGRRPTALMQNQHTRELMLERHHTNTTKMGVVYSKWINTGDIKSTRQTSSIHNVPLVEFINLVFTCMPGEMFTCMLGASYCRQLGSLLLCLCDVFEMLIISLLRSFRPQVCSCDPLWPSSVRLTPD